MKQAIVSTAKKAGYVVAGVVVISAVIVAASRLMTPYLDAHRVDIEQWAGDLLHAPIQIESARVSWFQYQPGVSLQNVTMLDQKTNRPAFKINTVKVFISIPDSIRQRKVVMSGILIAGSDIDIEKNSDGEYAIKAFANLMKEKTQEPVASKVMDVLAWLSIQPFIVMRDIDVHYKNPYGQIRYYTLNNLRLQNSGNSHSVVGDAVLHQSINTEISVAVRAEGTIEKWQEFSAKAFVQVRGLSLGQWLKGLSYQGYSVNQGLASAKIWATYRNNEMRSVQTNFELLDVNVSTPAKQPLETITRLSGEVGWKKENGFQILAGSDLLIDWESRLWPVTSFYLKLTQNQQQQWRPVVLNLGYLNIGDLRTILKSAPAFLPEKALQSLDAMHLTGNLESLSASFPANGASLMPSMVQGRFSKISLSPTAKNTAINNLAGSFNWSAQQGSVTLAAKDVSLHDSSVFLAPLQFDQFTGTVAWQQNDKQGWHISLTQLAALNRDITLNVSGLIDLDNALQPSVKLDGHFSLMNVMNVNQYLPMKVFSKNLNRWLNNAFAAGSIQDGSIKVSGKLNEFPFDRHNGEFTVSGAVHNIDLHYAPNWPNISNINGKLVFSGRKILIDVDTANILGVQLGKVQAEIPYLGDAKPSVLTAVAPQIQTEFKQALTFVHQSPLEKTLGKMFSKVSMQGPVSMALTLVVPLEDTDKITLKGGMDFTDAIMTLVPWKLDINKLHGHVDFTDETTTASNIQGELFNKPLRLDLNSIKNMKGHNIVQAVVTNAIDLHDIENWLHISFASTASGAGHFETRIDLAFDQPINIQLASSLEGIKLNLPDGYSKNENEHREFSAEMTLAEHQPLIVKLKYADLLSAALALNQEQNQFKLISANLNLGNGNAVLPKEPGLYVTGVLAALDEAKIKTYLGYSVGAGNGLALKNINLQIDKVTLYGMEINQAKFDLKPLPSAWQLQIDSDEIRGLITVPQKLTPASKITADMKNVNLDTLQSQQKNVMDFNPNTMPTIEFSTDNLTYSGMHLGSVSFDTKPNPTGFTVNNIAIRSSELKLDGAGSWEQDGKSNTTVFHGRASSDNVSSLINTLGFDAHNFVASKGKVDFDLSWNAAPSALSLASMSGTAKINLDKGRIVSVNDSSNAKMDFGRMINIFSLQNIPRRLSLDFSDVFEKGYSFDYMRADFNFDNGNASTHNMVFDGTLAKVEIRGRIGLGKQDFDLILSVTPYVTSSIPVAATLLTGQPVIGIAAWAVNKMIGGELSKAVTYYYSVNGTWSKPEWSMIQKAQATRSN